MVKQTSWKKVGWEKPVPNLYRINVLEGTLSVGGHVGFWSIDLKKNDNSIENIIFEYANEIADNGSKVLSRKCTILKRVEQPIICKYASLINELPQSVKKNISGYEKAYELNEINKDETFADNFLAEQEERRALGNNKNRVVCIY
jgi:hypothetical protein